MSKHHHHTRRAFLGRFSMGCASLGLTSLYSGITNMGLMNAAAAANRPAITSNNNYKALVCIMLNGGNDSYNMLIPRGDSEYQQYADVRTNIAIPKANLLPINATNVTGKTFGLHPNLSNVQQLFENGKLSFIANVGALVAPTTVSSFNNESNLPLGLFSHSDQRTHWQTSVPQNKNAKGWGGRLADILHTNNNNQDISMNISLEGVNYFQQGNTINGYSISHKNTGSVLVNGSSSNSFYQSLKRQTLDNILDQNYNNILEKAYANTVSNANGSSISFSAAISNSTPINTAFGEGKLAQKLKMVAKTIAARDILNVQNQTFFVELKGFDTHDNIMEEHGLLMTELDEALQSFYLALEELGVQNNVTTFTMSDFARKLISNGNGTDHAWGGHALVMGGAVNGQQIFGEYPELYIGAPNETGGGRFIPTTSCDEYFAELALWFGASSGDLDQIFPNLTNFWTPTTGEMPIGFMA